MANAQYPPNAGPSPLPKLFRDLAARTDPAIEARKKLADEQRSVLSQIPPRTPPWQRDIAVTAVDPNQVEIK
jgi:hypothetical protein